MAVQQSYPVLYIRSETEEGTLLAYASLRRDDNDKSVRALEVRNIWGVDPVSAQEERRFNEFRTLCLDVDARLGISEVKLGRFRPTYVPAIMVPTGANAKEAELIEHFLSEGQNVLSLNVVRYLKSQSNQIRLGKSMYTLYLNVANELVQAIADHVNEHHGDQDPVRMLVGELVLNAALPLFDDPSLTEKVLGLRNANALRGVNTRSALAEKENQNTLLKAEVERRLDPTEAVDLRAVPGKAERRTCATLILDLAKSTWMVGNVDLRDAGEVFADFVESVARLVRERGGHFDKFIGDGLLAEFFARDDSENSRRRAARDAYGCAKALVGEIDDFFQREPWHNLLLDASLVGPKARAAISWGPVYFGQYCGIGTAVGGPMVQAARLCAQKEFFVETKEHRSFSVIGTQPVFELVGLGADEAVDRLIARDWPIEGLGPVTVFGLYL